MSFETDHDVSINIDSRHGLIIFVRVPELGKVKTRLAADVGDYKALAIYEALLDHTRKVSLGVNVERFLFYTTAVVEDNWNNNDFIKKFNLAKTSVLEWPMLLTNY
ncbi:MAG: hypothetical protein V3V00_13415 [Saprospiraceae bacterium]